MNDEEIKVNVCALGWKIATGENGLEAEVIEIERLELLTKDQVKGK